MPTVIWELIVVIELVVMIYFAYRVLEGLQYTIISITDFVIRHLWITPTVYRRVSTRVILLMIFVPLRYPISYCLITVKAQGFIIDILNHMLNIFIIVLIMVIEIVRIVEHKIYSYISRLLK